MRQWVLLFDELWAISCCIPEWRNKWRAVIVESCVATIWYYVVASHIGSNKIFNTVVICRMLIDWVRSGQMGKNLALGQDYGPQAKYFPVRPSHSVNKYPYIISPITKYFDGLWSKNQFLCKWHWQMLGQPEKIWELLWIQLLLLVSYQQEKYGNQLLQ